MNIHDTIAILEKLQISKISKNMDEITDGVYSVDTEFMKYVYINLYGGKDPLLINVNLSKLFFIVSKSEFQPYSNKFDKKFITQRVIGLIVDNLGENIIDIQRTLQVIISTDRVDSILCDWELCNSSSSIIKTINIEELDDVTGVINKSLDSYSLNLKNISDDSITKTSGDELLTLDVKSFKGYKVYTITDMNNKRFRKIKYDDPLIESSNFELVFDSTNDLPDSLDIIASSALLANRAILADKALMADKATLSTNSTFSMNAELAKVASLANKATLADSAMNSNNADKLNNIIPSYFMQYNPANITPIDIVNARTRSFEIFQIASNTCGEEYHPIFKNITSSNYLTNGYGATILRVYTYHSLTEFAFNILGSSGNNNDAGYIFRRCKKRFDGGTIMDSGWVCINSPSDKPIHVSQNPPFYKDQLWAW